MSDSTAPPSTEPARSAWYAGARAEAALAVADMSQSGREVYKFVQVVARRGDHADQITDLSARVFTAGWPLRRRLALAWALIRG